MHLFAPLLRKNLGKMQSLLELSNKCARILVSEGLI